MVAASLADHVFGAHPPEVHLHRTLGVFGLASSGKSANRTGFPGYAFLDVHVRDLPGVERETFFRTLGWMSSYHQGRKMRWWLKRTDGEFWQVLRFDFVEGRPLTPEDVAAARRVAVINASTRESLFGDGSALGQRIEIEGSPHEVVGVVRDVPFLRIVPFADVWAPLTTAPNDAWRRQEHGDFQALLLAESPRRFSEIRAELARRVAGAVPTDPQFERHHAGADTPFEFLARSAFDPHAVDSQAAKLRLVLAVAALLFMLLPTINLVNLNLSRILERAAEIGVRKAFGASARALVGQFLVENVVLTLVGGLVGLLLAALALEGLEGLGWIPYADFGVNLRIFGWALALAVTFGVLSGVYPAWRMARLDPVQALRGRAAR
jgi:putative ABC transport system permease protein